VPPHDAVSNPPHAFEYEHLIGPTQEEPDTGSMGGQVGLEQGPLATLHVEAAPLHDALSKPPHELV
jgi:hypothetical protein